MEKKRLEKVFIEVYSQQDYKNYKRQKKIEKEEVQRAKGKNSEENQKLLSMYRKI